jgi:hypothetical protein
MLPTDHRPALLGRRNECEVLDRVVPDIRAGRSRTLGLRGEAGVAKTALIALLEPGAHAYVFTFG